MVIIAAFLFAIKNISPTESERIIEAAPVKPLPASSTEEFKYATFPDREGYQIFYFEDLEQFLISITASPFEQYRLRAEIDFLESLNISQREACSLDVVITTPARDNPEYAGKEYELSFCE